LVEHVAQMMRSSDAVARVYPGLNRDLLLAGVLFHDSGKLWENCFPKESFIMPYDVRGELIGHVSIGVELVNRLWQRLKESAEFSQWSSLTPDSESVRLHLVHLVSAHHGEKQFGSPVEPRTPEAITLHLIDNLDAKLEMMSNAYQLGKRLSAEVVERVRPLPTNLVEPLPVFSKEEQASQLEAGG
jgi:3'-5' exoribonuclease